MSKEALSQYAQLCQRLDQKFSEIRTLHKEQFACKLGCHSCCKPGLSVGRLEKEAIKQLLLSGLAAEAKELEASNPHKGKRCRFLKAEGECLIYEARPFVCRSHGAPLQMQSLDEEEVKLRSVCSLNFTTLDITKLPPVEVLNVDTLNTLLALLTKRAFPADKSRTELSVDALLK